MQNTVLDGLRVRLQKLQVLDPDVVIMYLCISVMFSTVVFLLSKGDLWNNNKSVQELSDQCGAVRVLNVHKSE